jgi:hypothetical protein
MPDKPISDQHRPPSPGSDPDLPTVEQELQAVNAYEGWLRKAHRVGNRIRQRVRQVIGSGDPRKAEPSRQRTD